MEKQLLIQEQQQPSKRDSSIDTDEMDQQSFVEDIANQCNPMPELPLSDFKFS